MLENTLESHLGRRKIKLVNPQGNQPWIFFGRTDAEAEAPILGPVDVKSQFIWKIPDPLTPMLSLLAYSSVDVWFPNVVVAVQSPSHVWLFVTPWTAARQASLSFTISWGLLRLMSIELVMLSNHLFLCHPLLLLPSIFPRIRVFSNESALCIRWPKYWSLRFSISPSSEYSGLISFRIDWFDFLAVQGTLRVFSNIPQFKSIILRRSAFFTVQL